MQRFSTVIGKVKAVRAVAGRRKSGLSIAALAAGWITVFADDIPAVPLTIPFGLHDDLARILLAATIALAVLATIRRRTFYAAMKLGREIEAESYRLATRRLRDDDTVGIGVPN